MVSRETKVTAGFVLLAVVLWAAASTVTENRLVQLAVLVGVGVVLPMALNQRRE